MSDSWASTYEGIAAMFTMFANVVKKPLSETVLEAAVEIGLREFGVAVDREGIRASGMFWTWDEWLAQGDLPPNWKRMAPTP